MKKLISVLLAMSLLLVCCLTLVSCGHECTFSEEWTTDETSHWHVCTGEECEEISDKADHTWNDGEITTKPTQEADGVKTFTCTVCALTRTEPVEFTGMTEDEWNSALTDDVFSNFAYKEISDITDFGLGATISTETRYSFTADDAWAKITIGAQSEESYAPSVQEAVALRNQMIASIKSMTDFASYQYNAETKSYSLKSGTSIYMEALGASTSDVTLKFDGGKLVEIKYSATFSSEGISCSVSSVVTLSDYGTVTLSKPA